jgi:RNA polymerase sigma factor (sigma-70 family)
MEINILRYLGMKPSQSHTYQTGLAQDRPSPPKKSSWILTQEAMDLLLARLHANREEAGVRYQDLRGKLTIYFEGRRCCNAEELTDETLNRLACKLASGESILDLNRYALGVARYVLKENQRRPESCAIQFDNLPPEYDLQVARKANSAALEAEEREWREEMMRRCLQEMPQHERELLNEYYQCEKNGRSEHRRKIAERLGMTPNALYLHIHRLRGRLFDRLERYIKQKQ